MKRWVELLFFLQWLLSGSVPLARADDPPKPIRALLVLGGCCHDYGHQKDILTRGISRRGRRVDRRLRPGHKHHAQEPRVRQPGLGEGL